MEKRALGRGLSALIPPKEVIVIDKQQEGGVLQIPIIQIKPNKYQPRTDFDQEKLNELMNSIKEKGVIQPVLVRKTPSGYELIAGERRLKAAKSLGVEKIPAIVKDVTDIDMLEISLIENIQREELNPIEEANSFQKFITDFNFTQEKIAQVLGKDRSTIANTIRLLSLPEKVRGFITKNLLSMGHAKAILGLPSGEEQTRVSNLVVKKGLSVRETEQLVSKRSSGVKRIKPGKDPNVADIEYKLQHILGTRVKINHGKKRGTIQIDYYSTEDLNRIVSIFAPKLS